MKIKIASNCAPTLNALGKKRIGTSNKKNYGTHGSLIHWIIWATLFITQYNILCLRYIGAITNVSINRIERKNLWLCSISVWLIFCLRKMKSVYLFLLDIFLCSNGVKKLRPNIVLQGNSIFTSQRRNQ